MAVVTELEPCPIDAAKQALIAAMLRHYRPGTEAQHPEIDRAFSDLLHAAGPVSVRQKSLREIFATRDEESACSA